MECCLACARDCLVPVIIESIKNIIGRQGCIGIIPDCIEACCGK